MSERCRRAVRELYRQEGWWPARELTDIAAMLSTGPHAGAWDGAELVGFARAVTDGVFRAYVEDVVVRPTRRRSGVGSRLLDCVHRQLGEVDVVSLFCSAELVSTYRDAGYAFTEQQVGHRRRRPPAG